MRKVNTHRGRHSVFVDPSGRRRRLVLGAGIASGCALTAYLVIVAIGLVTGSGAPLTPWPDAKPPHHEAAPRESQAPHQPKPSPSVITGPATKPRRTTPTTAAAPTTRSAAGTTHPATTAPARPGRGHGYGLTKSPGHRKP